jgi:hypothetical protein
MTAELRAKLGSTAKTGPISLVTDATVAVNYSLGTIGEVGVGVETPTFYSRVAVQGALTDDTAPFLDGASRKLKLSLGAQIGDHVTTDVSILVPLETESDLKIVPMVDSSIIVKW